MKPNPMQSSFRAHVQALADELTRARSPAPRVTLVAGPCAPWVHRALQRLRESYVAAQVSVRIVVVGEVSNRALSDLLDGTQGSGLFGEIEATIFMDLHARGSTKKLLVTAGKDWQPQGPVLLGFVGTPDEALSSWVKTFSGHLVPCPEPRWDEWDDVVLELAQEVGLAITPEARTYLITALGQDAAKMRNHIHILRNYFHESTSPLTLSEVEATCPFLRAEHIFQLDNLLRQGRGATAEALVLQLLARGESPLAILGVLLRHIRNARSTLSLGRCSAEQLARELRIPLSVARSFQSYVRKGPSDRFDHALQAAQSADMDLKSLRVSEALILAEVLDPLLVRQ